MPLLCQPLFPPVGAGSYGGDGEENAGDGGGVAGGGDGSVGPVCEGMAEGDVCMLSCQQGFFAEGVSGRLIGCWADCWDGFFGVSG